MVDPTLASARRARLIAGAEILPLREYDLNSDFEFAAAASGYPNLC